MNEPNDADGRIDFIFPRRLAWATLVTVLVAGGIAMWQMITWIQTIETRIEANERGIDKNDVMIVALETAVSALDDDNDAISRSIAVLDVKIDNMRDDIAQSDARVVEVVRLMNQIIAAQNGYQPYPQ